MIDCGDRFVTMSALVRMALALLRNELSECEGILDMAYEARGSRTMMSVERCMIAMGSVIFAQNISFCLHTEGYQ